MNIRHLATIAVASSLVLGSGLAWSAPHKAQTPAARTYVVKAGDGGWFKVAQAHHVSLPQLLAANKATTATPLRVGQTLKLPPQAKDPPRAGKVAKAAAPTTAPKR
jgi:LysM repeat protein